MLPHDKLNFMLVSMKKLIMKEFHRPVKHRQGGMSVFLKFSTFIFFPMDCWVLPVYDVTKFVETFFIWLND